MKVTVSWNDQQNAQKIRADLEPLVKIFEKSAGLDEVLLRVESGVIRIDGWNKDGKTDWTAIGSSAMQTSTPLALATIAIMRLRRKLGETVDFGHGRRKVGTIQIPNF